MFQRPRRKTPIILRKSNLEAKVILKKKNNVDYLKSQGLERYTVIDPSNSEKNKNNNNYVQNQYFNEDCGLNEGQFSNNDTDHSDFDKTEPFATKINLNTSQSERNYEENISNEKEHSSNTTVNMNAFQCEYCYVDFDNKVDMLVHIQEEHLDIKPEMFHCNHCPSTFVNEDQMMKHINNAHDDDPPIKSYGKTTKPYHSCFVPGCTSISSKFPDKIFVRVPSMLERRKQWFQAVNRDFSPQTKLFCCEDHFDLPNDAKNWLKYRLMGSCDLRIKDDVVPHIFPERAAEISPEKYKGLEEKSVTQQQHLLKTSNISSAEIDCVDLTSPSPPLPFLLTIQKIIDMPADQLEFHIQIEDSDPLQDTDWCINEQQQDSYLNITKNTLKQKNCENGQNEYKIMENGDQDNYKLKESIVSKTNKQTDMLKQGKDTNQNDYKKVDAKGDQDMLKQGKDTNQNDYKKVDAKDDQSLLCNADNVEGLAKIFQCNTCQSSFYSDDEMLHHIRVLHGTTYQYRSSITEDSLKHVNELIYDITKDNFTKDMFKKFINVQRFTRYDADSVGKVPIKNNVRGITKEKQTCTICQKEFSYKSWKSHMKEVHSDNQFVCKICGLTFKCKRYLRRHTLYSHENVVKSHERNNKLTCPECPKTFKNSDCLSHHINNCHGNEVECEICYSKLKSYSYLKSHMRRVHYEDGNIHKCNICHKVFKSPRQVKIHLINLHPETLLPCPYCVRKFCDVTTLNIHLKSCKKRRTLKMDPVATISIKDDTDISDDVDLTVD